MYSAELEKKELREGVAVELHDYARIVQVSIIFIIRL